MPKLICTYSVFSPRPRIISFRIIAQDAQNVFQTATLKDEGTMIMSTVVMCTMGLESVDMRHCVKRSFELVHASGDAWLLICLTSGCLSLYAMPGQ